MNEHTDMILYSRACRALADARNVDEVKQMRDKAEAMRAYARQAKNRQLEIDAAEIRFRAERAIGKLMEAQREAGLLNKGGGDHRVAERPGANASLADAGIDKHLADRARKLAAIPEAEFEGVVGDWRGRVEAENERVTVNLLARGHVHVSANSGDNEWYTPEAVIASARRVTGGFDLDPASSEIANRTVQAARYFTAEDDGLAQEWPVGRIWMNPPYAQPLCSRFCARFVEAVRAGSTGFVLVNNATETAWFQELAKVAAGIWFPQGRVRFLDPEGNPGAPLQGQALLYFGPDLGAFEEAFFGAGCVLRAA